MKAKANVLKETKVNRNRKLFFTSKIFDEVKVILFISQPNYLWESLLIYKHFKEIVNG